LSLLLLNYGWESQNALDYSYYLFKK